jgi:hypothetical protein
MKYRNGFVSNSSSASFVLEKKFCSEVQLEMVKNHLVEGKALGMEEDAGYVFHDYDSWSLEEKESIIEGYTSMTNFPMDEFFPKIGIPSKAYKIYRD